MGVVHRQNSLQKVINQVNTGRCGTADHVGLFSSDYNTASLQLLKKGSTACTTLALCHAVAHGSSFKPAGRGCGDGGKTAMQHQRNARTHTCTEYTLYTTKYLVLQTTFNGDVAKSKRKLSPFSRNCEEEI